MPGTDKWASSDDGLRWKWTAEGGVACWKPNEQLGHIVVVGLCNAVGEWIMMCCAGIMEVGMEIGLVCGGHTKKFPVLC